MRCGLAQFLKPLYSAEKMPITLPKSDNEYLLDNFYVIAVMTNPERFKTRPRLFKEFMARMDKYGAKLYVVEGAYGDRAFEVTDASNPRHKSFCERMTGMKRKMTGSAKAADPNSRINKSLRKWGC